MKQTKKAVHHILAGILLALPVLFTAQTASAAALTSMSDNLSREQISTLADHTIQFITPTGIVALSQNITLTFTSGFTTVSNVTAADVDIAVSAGASCASFTDRTVSGTSGGADSWGVSASGQVVTLAGPTSGTIGTSGVPAGRCVQVEIGSNAISGSAGATRITNPSSATSLPATNHRLTISVAGGADTGTLSIPIVTNDQVTVSATVDPTITFALGANSVGFGTLSSSAATYATTGGGSSSETSAHTLTVSTNASSGYSMYVRGATLTSGSFDIQAISGGPTASSPGSEQFGLRLTKASGSANGAVQSPYNGAAGSYGNSFTATAADDIATDPDTATSTVYNVFYLANIAGDTEAGSYTTTLTYTATGTF